MKKRIDSQALLASMLIGADATSKAHGEQESREPYRGVAKMFQPPKGNTEKTYGHSFMDRIRAAKTIREAKNVYAEAERGERITGATLRKLRKAVNARVVAAR